MHSDTFDNNVNLFTLCELQHYNDYRNSYVWKFLFKNAQEPDSKMLCTDLKRHLHHIL